MNSLFDIKDQVVVITGGTGVLGSMIGKYLAKEGCKVAFLSLPQEKELGDKLVAEIKADGGEACWFATNVLDAAIVEQNCKDILAKYGRVDTLLNAAGGNQKGATIADDQSIFDLDPKQFSFVLELNLTGTVIPTQVFLKPMKEQGKGQIVNFGSMTSFRPCTRVCGYSAAKSGIKSFTEYMASEVARKFGDGIRVNAIAPGFFVTNQNHDLLVNPDGSWTPRAEHIIQQTPFGRMGEPEELCGTIHYLISPASKFVTGTVAVVDGGFNVYCI